MDAVYKDFFLNEEKHQLRKRGTIDFQRSSDFSLAKLSGKATIRRQWIGLRWQNHERRNKLKKHCKYVLACEAVVQKSLSIIG
jgi:hypothetical protein